MPIGLWRVSDVTPSLESLRHKAVLFCPPDTAIFRWAKSNGVLHRGRCPGDYTPLLKEVVGLPGDLIEIRDNAVFLNGSRLSSSEIAKALSVKAFNNKEVIPMGSIWVMGVDSEASFDSRYFGPISLGKIIGLAHPLLTSRSAE